MSGRWSNVTQRIVFVVVLGVFVLVNVRTNLNAQTANSFAVRVIKDVSYLGEDRPEKLDLYLPVTRDAQRRAAVLIVHGGGWHGGDKAARREQNIGNTLAAAGFVCASVNYRLADRSDRLDDRLEQVWPGNLHDCKTAVRFLRKHADQYNIDPTRVAAIGGSAGGHLVAMLATTDPEDNLDPAGPYADYSCRIQAVIPMYGVHDVVLQAKKHGTYNDMNLQEQTLCRQASPIHYVTSDDPPALILHGTGDDRVPVIQSELLRDRLKQARVKCRLHVIKGAPHSFHLQPAQQDLRPLVISFLKQHLAEPKTGAENAQVKPPGSILDLSAWRLTLPIDRDRSGRPDEVEYPRLESFDHGEYFFAGNDPPSVIFRAHCGGSTSPGSDYPRCELRQMVPKKQQEIYWSTDDSTMHTMRMRAAITKLPAVKQHVVCAQIHDKDDDVIMIRLEGEKLFIERNSVDRVMLTRRYELGTPFDLKISAGKGRIQCWFNGQLKMDWMHSQDDCYFKAGCYTQSNERKGDKPDAFAEVRVYELGVSD